MVHAVQRESRIARQGKRVHREGRQLLDGILVPRAWARRGRSELGEAFRDEQNEVDQQSVRGTWNVSLLHYSPSRDQREIDSSPLISKLRKRQLARNRSRDSSMMSGWLGSAM